MAAIDHAASKREQYWACYLPQASKKLTRVRRTSVVGETVKVQMQADDDKDITTLLVDYTHTRAMDSTCLRALSYSGGAE